MAAKSRLGLDGYGVRRAGSFAGKTTSIPIIDSLLCAEIRAYCAVTGVPDAYAAVTGTPDILGCDT